jgi:hypothetical protein
MQQQQQQKQQQQTVMVWVNQSTVLCLFAGLVR